MRYNTLALYAGAGQGTGYPEAYLVLATIRSDKSFPEIQEIPARNAATASPFFVIESVSVGPADGFLIAGNFTGTRGSSVFPEAKEHNPYIHAFINSRKRLIS